MKDWGRIGTGLLLALFLCGNGYVELSGRYIVGVPAKLGFASGFVLLLSIFMQLGSSPTDSAARRCTRMRRYFWALFLYYLWILGNMLFFDAAFGRAHNGLQPHFNFYAVDINLEPLKTIRNYLRAYHNGNISGSLVAINLIGNLAAFAPMGVFLPTLWRPARNFFVFTLGMTVMICTVEFLQIFTRTGSCDVDDVILNVAGALVVWLVVQLPAVRRRLYDLSPIAKG